MRAFHLLHWGVLHMYWTVLYVMMGDSSTQHAPHNPSSLMIGEPPCFCGIKVSESLFRNLNNNRQMAAQSYYTQLRAHMHVHARTHARTHARMHAHVLTDKRKIISACAGTHMITQAHTDTWQKLPTGSIGMLHQGRHPARLENPCRLQLPSR